MNSPWCFRILSVIFLLAAASSRCAPAQAGDLKLTPLFNLVYATDHANLEFGPVFRMQEGAWVAKASIKAPLDQAQPDATIKIDRYTDALSGGGSLFWRFSRVLDENGGMREWLTGLNLEASLGKYAYYPLPGLEENITYETSVLIEGKLIYRRFGIGDNPGAHLFPQIKLRFSNTYGASPKLDLVIPAGPGEPAIIRHRITSPPDHEKTLTAAAAFPFYPGIGSMDAVPAVFTDVGIGSGTRKIRCEFWIRYFPADTGLEDIRAGLSPFVAWRSGAGATGSHPDIGVLFQVTFDAVNTLFL